MDNKLNDTSLDTLAAALAYAMGIPAPREAAEKNAALSEYIDTCFEGRKADRVVMYNPDAIAQWVSEKYPQLIREVEGNAGCRIPFRTVMPSVTPVCFGTMYTGAQPSVHGIRKYEKPVITIDSLFDALIRAGKKPVIITKEKTSLSKIFLEREMDYFIFDTIEEINAKAAEVILADTYDFIVIYNGNYDSVMHKKGPESIEALSEMRMNSETYAAFGKLIERNWAHHDTLFAFAMDHGCHEIDAGCGAHGLDMPEDLNIVHYYRGYPKKN